MFIVEKRPKSIPSESYRALRTSINYSSFDGDLRSILITSSDPEEGKSTTAGNLALSLAQEEKKVILIDCDLRRPTLHKSFEISNQKGLSEIIVERVLEIDSLKKYIYNNSTNLDVLTSGKIPPNPAEMLSSKAMEELLEKLKEMYDYIIIDSPPINVVTDAQILSTKVDGSVLVVRAGKTKKDRVMAAKKALEKVNARILGAVLNGAEQKKEKYYYY